jgi:acyl carrier protein
MGSQPLLEPAALRSNLKRLIVETLHLDGLTPERLDDDAPLFGGDFGLDSVDALELVVALEKEFAIRIQSHEVDKRAFTSVAHLADFVARTIARDRRGAELDGQQTLV